MIGSYVVRVNAAGAATTLAHLVESEIADRVISRCGREMHRRNRDGLLRTAGGADRTCFWCAARHDAAPSRQPTDEERAEFKRGELARVADLQEAALRTPPRPLSNVASSSQVDRSSDQPEPVALDQDDWSPV